jgi:hypothetical protein
VLINILYNCKESVNNYASEFVYCPLFWEMFSNGTVQGACCNLFCQPSIREISSLCQFYLQVQTRSSTEKPTSSQITKKKKPTQTIADARNSPYCNTYCHMSVARQWLSSRHVMATTERHTHTTEKLL